MSRRGCCWSGLAKKGNDKSCMAYQLILISVNIGIPFATLMLD